jgi:hypothetical protein
MAYQIKPLLGHGVGPIKAAFRLPIFLAGYAGINLYPPMDRQRPFFHPGFGYFLRPGLDPALLCGCSEGQRSQKVRRVLIEILLTFLI